MLKKLLFSMFFALPLIWASAQNNVGIGTTNPVSKLDVRGNGIAYDVLNVSNDKSAPLDSILVLSDRGYMGLGTTLVGNYRLVAEGRPSAFSPQVEVWTGNPNSPPGTTFMLADIVDFGAPPLNGTLNLYNAGSVNVSIQAGGDSYLNGGKLGIGKTLPLESLHLFGAAILGPRLNVGSEAPGTIEWNGTNFVGWIGPGTSVNLDAQMMVDNDWQVLVSGYTPPLPQPPPFNPELVPMTPPASLSMSFPGDPNQGGIVWIPDRPLALQYPHQLMLESTTNLASDASMLFRMSDWSVYVPEQVPPLFLDDYSQGIFRNDMSFKLYRGTTLAPSFQGDAFSMWRSHPSGIFDLPNQSRIRATVTNIDWGSWQLIQPNLWTPVNFTNPVIIPPAPYPAGFPWFDEHNEFTVTLNPNDPINLDSQGNPIPNSFFTATEEGYYQVNARCEFETDEFLEVDPGGGGVIIQPVYMRPDAYVAIAIYYEFQGTWFNYAEGNHLQTTNNVQRLPINPQYEDATETMHNNNAPNVSDILYLQPGDRIAIYVFHWAYTPMMIRVGDNTLYVSIHKIS